MKNKGMMWAVIVVVLVAIVGGAYALIKPLPTDIPVTATTTPQAPATTGTTASGSASGGTVTGTTATVTTVLYTDNGFAPNSITIKKGSKVTFINQSSHKMWVAAADHPEHTSYSGTDKSEHCPDTSGVAFDQCAGVDAGGSYTFTFTKVGTWEYHNHALDNDKGTVIVQ